MKRAFILCRPSDMPIARACQAHMRALGWHADIMIDPREWSEMPSDTIPGYYGTQGRGMFGNACAAAILDGIIMHSHPGDVVIKMDCDVRISPEASEWLSQAGQAKAMQVEYWGKIQSWGGMWSATHEHAVEARAHADSLKRCQCAESYLNLKCLHQTSPGLEIRQELVAQWQPGEPRGFVATLPITRRADRVVEGLRIFTENS